jgi:hypothetical protein
MMKIFQAIVSFGFVFGKQLDQEDHRNKFWRHLIKENSGLNDGDGEHFGDMQRCIQSALLDSIQEKTVPKIIDTIVDSEKRTILIEIGNAITPSQVKAVKHLAACTREFFPKSRFEHRNFEHAYGGGGNDCTFVNILLQIFLPEVYENVVNIAQLAYETAGWGEQLDLRPPSKCGLRTSEYLNYEEFKGLGKHTDTGSLFTALFALSDPKLYEGGEFYIEPRDAHNRFYFIKPRQYSAVVFLSETDHGVTDINGPREMFTNEFWIYNDPPWSFAMREENAHMDVFVKRVEEKLDSTAVDYYKREDLDDLWPDVDEVPPFDYFHNGYGFYEDEDEDDEPSVQEVGSCENGHGCREEE